MTVWRVLLALLALLSMAGAADAAQPERRIALVIGIGSYRHASELPNPFNDAKAMAAAFRRLGFEVDELHDLDNRSFNAALRDFGLKAGQADVAVLYYAGHGIQVGGHNFLVPTDARLERERDLVYEAIPLNLPLGELAQARKLGILILDACRNNPFVDRLARTSGARVAVSSGFARVEDTPSDTLVAMATRADAVAEDGTGQNSPSTAALLKHLRTPGVELSLFFREVRDEVKRSTSGRQEPYIFGSLGATPFYFNPQPPNRPPVVAATGRVEALDRGRAEALRILRPTDPDDDQLFAQVTALPRGGSVRVGDRAVLVGDYLTADQLAAATFHPDASLVGDAGSFEFAVLDSKGGIARGAVPVSVKAVNRPPVAAQSRTLAVSANPLGIDPPVDPDGDPLRITVLSVPERGKVRDGERAVAVGDRLNPEALAALTYDPERARPGRAGALRLAVEDGRGGRVESEVAVEVAPPGEMAAADLERELWQRVRDSGDAEDLRAFARLFADGPHAPLLRERLARLSPPEAPKPAPTAAGGHGPAPEPMRVASLDPPPAPDGARGQGQANGFRDCDACPAMVRVPPGTFLMGRDGGPAAERPLRQVTLPRAFALGAHEVTVGEWKACLEEGGCASMPRMTGATDRTPVHNVNWNEVQAYLRWLGRKTGAAYRLPTEAEWEHAARAGTTTPYWFGASVPAGGANCQDCGGPFERLTPAAAGSFKGNPFGLHDMNGGVAEWVADCWSPTHAGAPADGRARDEPNCRQRTLRGGSWRSQRSEITATARSGYDADVRYLENGFRVARDIE